MKREIDFRTLILVFTVFIVAVTLTACGGDRFSIPSPVIDSDCEGEDCPDSEEPEEPFDEEDSFEESTAKTWRRELYIESSSTFRDFLKDYNICDPPGWFILGRRCVDWRVQGSISLTIQGAGLPSSGQVVFGIFHKNGSRRNISISGNFQSWNDDRGFTLWSSPASHPLNKTGILKVLVEEGSPSDDQFEVEVYYQNKLMGHGIVFADQ